VARVLRGLGCVCAAALAVLVAAPARAQNGAPIGDAATLRDFMIQDICLDATGAVLPRTSPVDRGRCTRRRDLRPGERLPYHKQDQPSPDENGAAPLGYQRHDSFPVETALYGAVVEHSSDFGTGERRFGFFDVGSDGGDIAILSPGAASLGATEDGGAGFQLFAAACEGALTANALTHSWIIALFDPDRPAPLAGETVAHLDDLTRGRQDKCPAQLNAAFTRWRVVPFRYRAVPGQGAPMTMTTIVSEHYGDHVERFYFTRELGGTRWERWQNAAGNARTSAAEIARMGASFAATNRCSPSPMPAGGATYVLVDCREWSRIVHAADPKGDPPGFFIAALRRRPDAPRFFAPAGCCR
jgi:hypothetical protein